MSCPCHAGFRKHYLPLSGDAPSPRAQHPLQQGTTMQTHVIISYDGTDNDHDALALGRILGDAGARVSLAYVRHSPEADAAAEQAADAEAQALLERGAQWLGHPEVSRHVVLSGSTGDGLRALAVRERADLRRLRLRLAHRPGPRSARSVGAAPDGRRTGFDRHRGRRSAQPRRRQPADDRPRRRRGRRRRAADRRAARRPRRDPAGAALAGRPRPARRRLAPREPRRGGSA